MNEKDLIEPSKKQLKSTRSAFFGKIFSYVSILGYLVTTIGTTMFIFFGFRSYILGGLLFLSFAGTANPDFDAEGAASIFEYIASNLRTFGTYLCIIAIVTLVLAVVSLRLFNADENNLHINRKKIAKAITITAICCISFLVFSFILIGVFS